MLAVDERREAPRGEPIDVLPYVQDGAARRIDEDAAPGAQIRHLLDRDAEGGENHHVARPDRSEAGSTSVRLPQEPDAHLLQAQVHVRVVDDLAGDVDAS